MGQPRQHATKHGLGPRGPEQQFQEQRKEPQHQPEEEHFRLDVGGAEREHADRRHQQHRDALEHGQVTPEHAVHRHQHEHGQDHIDPLADLEELRLAHPLAKETRQHRRVQRHAVALAHGGVPRELHLRGIGEVRALVNPVHVGVDETAMDGRRRQVPPERQKEHDDGGRFGHD